MMTGGSPSPYFARRNSSDAIPQTSPTTKAATIHLRSRRRRGTGAGDVVSSSMTNPLSSPLLVDDALDDLVQRVSRREADRRLHLLERRHASRKIVERLAVGVLVAQVLDGRL